MEYECTECGINGWDLPIEEDEFDYWFTVENGVEYCLGCAEMGALDSEDDLWDND